MDSFVLTAAVWLMALSSALMAGTYLAFSMVIMRSLARLPALAGMTAMNVINDEILKTAFMPLFLGSSALSFAMIMFGFWHLDEPGAGLVIGAGSAYLLGMFGVTAAANVPLNNALQSAADAKQAPDIWQDYLVRWTRWNSIRAIACVATLGLCIALL